MTAEYALELHDSPFLLCEAEVARQLKTVSADIYDINELTYWLASNCSPSNEGGPQAGGADPDEAMMTAVRQALEDHEYLQPIPRHPGMYYLTPADSEDALRYQEYRQAVDALVAALYELPEAKVGQPISEKAWVSFARDRGLLPEGHTEIQRWKRLLRYHPCLAEPSYTQLILRDSPISAFPEEPPIEKKEIAATPQHAASGATVSRLSNREERKATNNVRAMHQRNDLEADPSAVGLTPPPVLIRAAGGLGLAVEPTPISTETALQGTMQSGSPKSAKERTLSTMATPSTLSRRTLAAFASGHPEGLHSAEVSASHGDRRAPKWHSGGFELDVKVAEPIILDALNAIHWGTLVERPFTAQALIQKIVKHAPSLRRMPISELLQEHLKADPRYDFYKKYNVYVAMPLGATEDDRLTARSHIKQLYADAHTLVKHLVEMHTADAPLPLSHMPRLAKELLGVQIPERYRSLFKTFIRQNNHIINVSSGYITPASPSELGPGN